MTDSFQIIEMNTNNYILMKTTNKILSFLTFALLFVFASCESGRSYSELLDEENYSVNRFLVDNIVYAEIPSDSVFEVGPNAPYYRIEDEGNVYMQVLNPGDGEKVVSDQQVYFRFLRYNLSYYYGSLSSCPTEGNQDDMTASPTSFRFDNYSLPSSSAWGQGIQMPLKFLKLNSEANVIIKSQFGWTSEISNVTPYLYHVRYYKGQI